MSNKKKAVAKVKRSGSIETDNRAPEGPMITKDSRRSNAYESGKNHTAGSKRGGANRGQGRVALDINGDKVKTKPRYVTVSEEDLEKLTRFGKGNASFGVRALAQAALESKHEYTVVVSLRGRGQNRAALSPNGERLMLRKSALHVDDETYYRIMDLSGSGFSAGVRMLVTHLDRNGKLIKK